MSITKHLAVIVSTERLWPYDVISAAGDLVSATFGLNLVTAIVPTPGAADPLAAADLTLLMPWLWGELSGVVLLAQRGGTTKPLATKVTPIAYPFPVAPADKAAQKAAMVAAMEARFATMRQAGPGLDPDAPFLWDPANPKGDETTSSALFRHLLGSTSTMPAPVPYALNLAICVRVDAADIDASFLVSGQIADDTVLLAAPAFPLPAPAGGAAPGAVTPSTATPRPPVPFPDVASPMWQWPCDVTDGTGAPDPAATPVLAYTVAINLKAPKPDLKASHFDMSSYWILNDGSVDKVLSADWSTRLADVLADAWNLPRLLLDAIPALTLKGQLAAPQAYFQAIVACLHDRAGLGWIDGPDGAGLIRFALTRAADGALALADPKRPGAIVDPRRARAASWQALKDGWTRSLRSRLRKYDLAMTYDAWTTALLTVLPDLRAPFPTGPIPADATHPKDDYSLLERILSKLGNNLTLARLLIDGDGSEAGAGLWKLAILNATPTTLAAKAIEEDFVENSAVDPAAATFGDAGTLDLSDGSEWAITLGNIAAGGAWDGFEYSITLNHRPAGVAPRPFKVTITQAHDGGAPSKPILKFHLSDFAGGPLGDFTSGPVPDPPVPYHVRLRIRRDTSVATARGVKSAFFVTLQVDATPDDTASAPTWSIPVAGMPVSLIPGAPMDATSLAVANELAGQPSLTYSPLSAVSARGSTAAEVFADWDKDLLLDKAKYAWRTFGASIRADLPVDDATSGINIQRRLALGNIGRAWPVLHAAMEGSPDEIQGLTTAFAAQLSAAFASRMNNTGAYSDYRPQPAPLPSAPQILAVGPIIQAYAEGFATAKLTPPKAIADASPATISQALVLQLERSGGFDDVDPVSDNVTDADVLRQVAGVGVLMQQALPGGAAASFDGRWHALNLGTLTAFSDTDDYPTVPSTGPVVTPVRVSYRDGARQSIVSYDNNPLAARSLLARFARFKNVGEKFDPDDDSPNPAFRYDAVTDVGANPWALLPALKFGQFYRVLPYLVGNSGALPAELSEGHPAQLRAANTLGTPRADVLRQLAYRRRVGVGLPRLSGVVLNQLATPPSSTPATLIQAYPQGGVPLARELEINAVTASCPRAIFFYDTAARVGLLPADKHWTITLARVILTGVAPTTSTASSVAFGLEGLDPTNLAAAIKVQVRRQGPTLLATPLAGPPGTEASGTAATIAITVDSTPIDLRLTRTAPGLGLGWRPSDVDGTWIDTPLTLPAPTVALTSARLVVDLVATDGPVSTEVLTFATPRFHPDGTSDASGDTPAPRDEPPLLIVAARDGGALSSIAPWRADFGIRLPATDLQT